MKAFVAIDLQNDFVTGSLGTAEAVAILPRAAEKIRAAHTAGNEILVTLDTHGENYLSTQEGKNLPVEHCLRGAPGWELCAEVKDALKGVHYRCFEKGSFGSPELAEYLRERRCGEVELIGLCTDICVISNALLIKAISPETLITVDAACCAGVTPESHRTALAAMKACQIKITAE